jgi:hypothetical protein
MTFKIDFIGDVHGHADKLEKLFNKLGYEKSNTGWHHPERTTVFIGDYIDRGPAIPETLQIIKKMVDSGQAIALMGNHEYNAICFHTQKVNGEFYRSHSVKNQHQHRKTLEAFRSHPQELEFWINWFRGLPLFYETPFFRAVHACWDEESIETIKSIQMGGPLTNDLLDIFNSEGSDAYQAIELCLKGKEIRLPEGLTFEDKDGMIRKEIRVKWWEDPAKSTYGSYSIPKFDSLNDHIVDHTELPNKNYYKPDDKPVFFGHYWLSNPPWLFRNNICCLDFSVAKGGHLVAYRFDGEQQLEEKKFVISNL